MNTQLYQKAKQCYIVAQFKLNFDQQYTEKKLTEEINKYNEKHVLDEQERCQALDKLVQAKHELLDLVDDIYSNPTCIENKLKLVLELKHKIHNSRTMQQDMEAKAHIFDMAKEFSSTTTRSMKTFLEASDTFKHVLQILINKKN